MKKIAKTLLVAAALCLAAPSLAEAGDTGSTLDAVPGRMLLAQKRKRKKRRKKPAPAPEAAPAAAEPEPAPAAETVTESLEASDAGEAEVATEEVAAGNTLRRSNRMEFDARVIKGQTATSGAVYLFNRAPRQLPPLLKLKQSYLKLIVEPVLGPQGEEEVR